MTKFVYRSRSGKLDRVEVVKEYSTCWEVKVKNLRRGFYVFKDPITAERGNFEDAEDAYKHANRFCKRKINKSYKTITTFEDISSENYELYQRVNQEKRTMPLQNLIRHLLYTLIIVITCVFAFIVRDALAEEPDQESVIDCIVCTMDLTDYLDARRTGDIEEAARRYVSLKEGFCFKRFIATEEYYCRIFSDMYSQSNK